MANTEIMAQPDNVFLTGDGLMRQARQRLSKFADVVWEVAAVCAKSVATLLNYKKTGKLPGNMERSVESRLEAGEIIQQQQERDL